MLAAITVNNTLLFCKVLLFYIDMSETLATVKGRLHYEAFLVRCKKSCPLAGASVTLVPIINLHLFFLLKNYRYRTLYKYFNFKI